uniref:Uncharacterized protein n=1 Tax=Emiliania huxleyi TaxID=2903 RepID=A0A6U8N5N9_EMIHU
MHGRKLQCAEITETKPPRNRLGTCSLGGAHWRSPVPISEGAHGRRECVLTGAAFSRAGHTLLGFSLCTQIPQSEETWSEARGQGRPSEQLRAGGQDWGEERDIDIVD